MTSVLLPTPKPAVSIVNVALPQMRHDLHLSVAGQQWVVNAYTLTFAGFLLLGGRAADLFGRRRVFMIGLGTFTFWSLIGGLAGSGGMLIGARAAQGIGGAILAPATIVTLALGLAILATFVVIEARIAAEPLVPLGVFRRRSLSAANGFGLTIGAALFGTYFFLALFLQQIDGYSPLVNGLATLPSALGTLAATRVGTRLVRTLGPRRQLVIGPMVAAGGLFWLSNLHPGQGYAAHILAPVVAIGVGFGLSFVPMVLAATTGLPPHQAGLASGLINTTRQIGGAIGLAALATVASNLAAHHGSGAVATRVALARGYDRAFLLSAAVLVVGAAIALLIPGPDEPPPIWATKNTGFGARLLRTRRPRAQEPVGVGRWCT